MGFTAFGLSDHIMRGVRAAGHTVPTPIQTLAIHPAMAGKDIVASAQTGTGKTAAFVLPLLHRLAGGSASRPGIRPPRALILTPTRELAQQVQGAFVTYGRFLPLRSVAIYGGAGMTVQTEALRRGVDIIVATPGRLLDHLQKGSVDVSGIQVLVLDEADRMLDMGFIRDVTKIVDRIPSNRQTLLFSATLSADITTLAARFLRDPQTVESDKKRKPAEGVSHHFYEARGDMKVSLLLHALRTEAMESVLVFSRTKHGADKICRRLEREGIASVAIHSNRTQAQRERALEGFKEGKFRVLVATDIAARGIDVTGISHVVNFDVPRYAEDYIHRIGRTGRAGASGDAVTFVSPEERVYMDRIEQFVGKRYPVTRYPGMPGEQAHAVDGANKAVRNDRPRTNPRTRSPLKPRVRPGPQLSSPPRRKKGAVKKMDTYSSGYDGQGWSNY